MVTFLTTPRSFSTGWCKWFKKFFPCSFVFFPSLCETDTQRVVLLLYHCWMQVCKNLSTNCIRVNIAGGEVSTGHEVVPYLQPVPPRGSGLHRYVFTLFTHTSHIDPDTPVGDTWCAITLYTVSTKNIPTSEQETMNILIMWFFAGCHRGHFPLLSS